MTSTRFFSAAPGPMGGGTWQQSNLALGRLIRNRRTELGKASALAALIHKRLTDLFPLLDNLCRSTCPWCPDPCCIVNKVWFDFQDLLFMHLCEHPIPPVQLRGEMNDACPYLNHRGCMLPRIIRPWACTRYICATQANHLSKKTKSSRETLETAFASIRIARMGMEDALLEAISPERRPPSV